MIDADDVLPIIQLMSMLCPNCRERAIAAAQYEMSNLGEAPVAAIRRPSLSPSSMNHTSSAPVPCVTYNVKADSGPEVGRPKISLSVVGQSESAKMIIP